MGADSEYAIWFDDRTGDPEWVIGLSSELAEGSIDLGYAHSNQLSSCPTETNIWTEYWNSVSESNSNAVADCKGNRFS